MTYIDYMNQFWKMNMSVEFSSNEAFLYFYLLNECNIRGWQNPFEHPNKTIVLATGMAEKTVIEVRNRLQQKGLIEFVSGKRNVKSPTYYLLDVSRKGSNMVSRTGSNLVSKEVSSYKNKEIRDKTLSPTRTRESHAVGDLFPDSDVFEKSLEECFDELKTNQPWKETVCMNIRIRDKTFMPADFDQYLKSFFQKLANEGEIRKAPKDAMSHFSRWLDIKLKSKKDGKQQERGIDTADRKPVRVRSVDL